MSEYHYWTSEEKAAVERALREAYERVYGQKGWWWASNGQEQDASPGKASEDK